MPGRMTRTVSWPCSSSRQQVRLSLGPSPPIRLPVLGGATRPRVPPEPRPNGLLWLKWLWPA